MFPSSAPAPTGQAPLSGFDGANPNGIWALYVTGGEALEVVFGHGVEVIYGPSWRHGPKRD